MDWVPRRKPQMPSLMGELTANLLMLADAWYAMAEEHVPGRYQSSDRFEVFGLLWRLLSRRFHGFRELPARGSIIPLLEHDSVGLKVRSPGRVPVDAELVERQLLRYGFRVEERSGSSRREILLSCCHSEGAKVLAFPTDLAAKKTKKSREAK